jgi:hypothetical protein
MSVGLSLRHALEWPMSLTIIRRELIAVLTAAAAWPLAARAHNRRLEFFGWVLTTTNGPAPGHETFEATMSRLGYRQVMPPATSIACRTGGGFGASQRRCDRDSDDTGFARR